MENSQFCFLHNPDIPEVEKRTAQVKGGKATIIKVSQSLPLVRVKNPQDVVTLLETTINEVRSGELDPRIANTIGYLTGGLLKAFEIGEVNRRVTAIEEAIKE